MGPPAYMSQDTETESPVQNVPAQAAPRSAGPSQPSFEDILAAANAPPPPPKPAPKPVPAPKATGRAQAAASAKLDLAKARSVADQLEATSINFGRYKGQKLGDLDPVYLDWVRGQPQILAVHKILRAYLDLPHINQRVDRALKRAGK